MRKGLWLALALGLLLVLVAVFVVSLFLVKVLWAWTVPDLFPKAVEQGLVAGTISWLTALKIAILIAVLSGITGIRGRKEK